MNRCAILFGLLSALVLPAWAQALGSVIVGNEPLGPGFGFDKQVLEAINVDERIILYHHDASLTIYFKGGPKAINLMMQRFMAIPADKREIILLPAPAKERIYDKKPLEYDWCLFVPINRAFRDDPGVATLTIYIPELLPPPLAEAQKAKKWIAELGSNDFKTRELASKELVALGPPVAKTLRDALRGKLSAEARDRIEKILDSVSTKLHVESISVPAGATVASLDDLLIRYRKELSDKDPEARGRGAYNLVHVGAPVEEILPDLEKVLKNDKEPAALISAAWGAYYHGADAKPLLPVLRVTAESADKNVAEASKKAIENIGRPKANSISEEVAKKRDAIRKEIKEFVAGIK